MRENGRNEGFKRSNFNDEIICLANHARAARQAPFSQGEYREREESHSCKIQVPFFIDPAWSTLQADFDEAGAVCTTTSGVYIEGTLLVLRMAHRKWKEIKQQPSMLPVPAVPGCSLFSFRILWAILSTSTVLFCG